MKNDHILVESVAGKLGDIGLITLNRAKTLNALTQEMCVVIDQTLADWAFDDAIKAVVIRGEGDKAFCAGGDIRALYQAGPENSKKSLEFFQHEYAMNRRIYHFPKPYIALCHGITMGGGMGISTHGSHRVAANDLRLAMPETAIGFFTDIGASFFLPRCPGYLGYYLGLTGNTINIADAVYCGLVDHIVPKESFDTLIQALCDAELSDYADVTQVIKQFSTEPEDSALVVQRKIIDDCFAKNTVEAIRDYLLTQNQEWSTRQAEVLNKRSPTSLKIVLAMLQKGKELVFNQCMDMEYNLVQYMLKQPDLYEGIRAAVIDKDRNPQWSPAELIQVKIEPVRFEI